MEKGEQSGNTQKIVDVYLDCDNDSLLYEVEQKERYRMSHWQRSCFYQKYKDGKWLVNDPVLKDPSSIYDKQ